MGDGATVTVFGFGIDVFVNRGDVVMVMGPGAIVVWSGLLVMGGDVAMVGYMGVNYYRM